MVNNEPVYKELDAPGLQLPWLLGGVWRTASVTAEPEIQLHRWRVIEVKGERFFVGYRPDKWEGRVSTAIQEFDPTTRKGRTESGRVYELVGPAGCDSDAQYVLDYWMAVYGYTDADITDVELEA